MVTRDKLKDYGFKEIGHYSVMNTLTLNLGRNRLLTIGCVGSPNESMYIQSVDDDENPTEVTDLVCVHNYDYDGYLTEDKLTHLLKGLGVKQ